MDRFSDRVALVTGSTSGIGEATARQLASEGATVVINSISSVAVGDKVVAELTDTGATASYVQCDISDPDQCRSMVETVIERYGKLDVLVNNAGVTKVIPHPDLDAVTPEVFHEIFDVNVFGTFELTRLALPHLKATGDGAVVTVTSIAGIRPTGSSIPYAASKAALNHLTRLLAHVSGPEVRINAVAPGLVRTPWTKDWGPVHEMVAERAPLGRSAEPEDIATVIADVAAARYMTGEVVLVDGGLSLWG